MSRIGDALKRAATTGQPAAAVIDSSVERPPDAVNVSDLTLYATEPAGAEPPPPAARSIPPAPPKAQATAEERRHAEPATPPVTWDNKLVVAGQMPPIAIEQYRRLAGTLHELQQQRGIKRLMVSSALPREGKTLSVTNLALTLSQSYRRKVLLIDADLRHPSIHEVFGLGNASGLADLVRSGGHEQPVIRVSEHLSILTAGRRDANPLAQLSSRHVEEFLYAAAQQFDWVLMDAPPIGLISDAQVVARLCDAALFVIAAGSTPFTLVQRGIAELGADRVVGVVLNRMQRNDLPHNEHYGHYYYNAQISSGA